MHIGGKGEWKIRYDSPNDKNKLQHTKGAANSPPSQHKHT